MNNELIENIAKIHTTEMGVDRIRRNLSLGDTDVVKWCCSRILDKSAVIERRGKNWYIHTENVVITVNAHSYTIITAHKEGELMKNIYLAGGCFWGVQKFIDQFDGIIRTEVGYANGDKADPTYEEVCNDSGHAETVKVEYDDRIISTSELIGYYFLVIDPLSVNRQGGDRGIQYRTGIYYEDESLLSDIRSAVGKESEKYDRPLAVEVMRLKNFYSAEEYHQKYLDKNPTGYCHINPAMMNIKKK